MFDHLRYRRGEVEPHSPAGVHTIQKLDLNVKEAVDYRDSLITHLARCASDLAHATRMLDQSEELEREAKTPIEKADATDAVRLAKVAIAEIEDLLEKSIGPLALASAQAQS